MPTIYHSLPIKTSASKIFEAVSNPFHLEKWWPLKCSGEAKIDAMYNFNFTDAYDWYAQVNHCIHNESIYFKMTKSDPDWDSTTFGFSIEELKGNTWLHFFHKDWQTENQHFKHSSYCWAVLLKGLKNYLEQDLIIPFEERS
jgi:uncharacterized protein YndB with AHSA1/START domain